MWYHCYCLKLCNIPPLTFKVVKISTIISTDHRQLQQHITSQDHCHCLSNPLNFANDHLSIQRPDLLVKRCLKERSILTCSNNRVLGLMLEDIVQNPCHLSWVISPIPGNGLFIADSLFLHKPVLDYCQIHSAESFFYFQLRRKLKIYDSLDVK